MSRTEPKDPDLAQERSKGQTEDQSEGQTEVLPRKQEIKPTEKYSKSRSHYLKTLKKLDGMLKNLYASEQVEYPPETRMATSVEFMQRLKALCDIISARPCTSSQQSVCESHDPTEATAERVRGYRRSLKRIHPSAFKNAPTSGPISQKRSEANPKTGAIPKGTKTSSAAKSQQVQTSSSTGNPSQAEPLVDWTQEEIDLAMATLQEKFPDQLISLQGRKIISSRRSTATIVSENNETTKNDIETIDLTQDDDPEIESHSKPSADAYRFMTWDEIQQMKKDEAAKNNATDKDLMPAPETKRADDGFRLRTWEELEQMKKDEEAKNNSTDKKMMPAPEKKRDKHGFRLLSWDELQQMKREEEAAKEKASGSMLDWLEYSLQEDEPFGKLRPLNSDELQLMKKFKTFKTNTPDVTSELVQEPVRENEQLPMKKEEAASEIETIDLTSELYQEPVMKIERPADKFRLPTWDELQQMIKDEAARKKKEADNMTPEIEQPDDDSKILQVKKKTPKVPETKLPDDLQKPTPDEIQQKKQTSKHNTPGHKKTVRGTEQPSKDENQQMKKKTPKKSSPYNNEMPETGKKPVPDNSHKHVLNKNQQMKNKTSTSNLPNQNDMRQTGKKPVPKTTQVNENFRVLASEKNQQIQKITNSSDHNGMPEVDKKSLLKTEPDESFRLPSWNELQKMIKETTHDIPVQDLVPEKVGKTGTKPKKPGFMLPTLDELQKLIKEVSSDHNVVEKAKTAPKTVICHDDFKPPTWAELQKMLKVTSSDDETSDTNVVSEIVETPVTEPERPDINCLVPTLNEPEQIVQEETASDNEQPDQNVEPEMLEESNPETEQPEEEFRLPTWSELQQMIKEATSNIDRPETVQSDDGFIFPTWNELNKLIREVSSYNVVSEKDRKPTLKTVRFLNGFLRPSWDELQDMLKEALSDEDTSDNELPDMVDIAVAETEPYADDFPILDEPQNLPVDDQNEIPELVETENFDIPTLKELDNMSKDVPVDSDTFNHNMVSEIVEHSVLELEQSHGSVNDSNEVTKIPDSSLTAEINQTLDIGAEVEIPYEDNSSQYTPFKLWHNVYKKKSSKTKTSTLEKNTEIDSRTTKNTSVASTQPKINLPASEAKIYTYVPFPQLNTARPSYSQVAAGNTDKTQDKKSVESLFNGNKNAKKSSQKYIPFRVIDENYLRVVGSSTSDNMSSNTDPVSEPCKNDDESHQPKKIVSTTFNQVTLGQTQSIIPTPDLLNDNVITLYKSHRHCNEDYKELLRRQKKERIAAATGTPAARFPPGGHFTSQRPPAKSDVYGTSNKSFYLPRSSAPSTVTSANFEIPVHIGERNSIPGTSNEVFPDNNSEERRNDLSKGIITFENYRSNSRYEAPQTYDYHHLSTRASDLNNQQKARQDPLIFIDCHGNQNNEEAKENYRHLSSDYPQEAPNYGHHILSCGNNLYAQEAPQPSNYNRRIQNPVNNPYAQETPKSSNYGHPIMSCDKPRRPSNYAQQVLNSGNNSFGQEAPKQSNYGHQIPNSSSNPYAQKPLQPSNYGREISSCDHSLYAQKSSNSYSNNPYAQGASNYGTHIQNPDPYVPKPSSSGHIPSFDNNPYETRDFQPYDNTFGNYSKYSTEDNVSAELDTSIEKEKPKVLNLEAYYQRLATLLHNYYNQQRAQEAANADTSQDNTRQKSNRVPPLPPPYYQVDYANILEDFGTPMVPNEYDRTASSLDNAGTTRRQQLPEVPPPNTSTGAIPRTNQYSYYNPDRFRQYLQERVEEVKTEFSAAAGINFPAPFGPHVNSLGTQPRVPVVQTPQFPPPGDAAVRGGLGRVFVRGGGRGPAERGSTERGRPIRGQRESQGSSNIRLV